MTTPLRVNKGPRWAALRKRIIGGVGAWMLVVLSGGLSAQEPEIIWLDEQTIIATVADENVELFGSTVTTGDYTQATLTGIQRDGETINETGGGTGEHSGDNIVVRPNWGVAEILFHCDSADVAIYRNTDAGLVEMIAVNVPTGPC